MSEQRKVRARHAGLYDGHRRPGEVFTIAAAEHFAASWMDAVGWTPTAAAATLAAPVSVVPAEEHAKVVARVAELEGMLQAERAEHAKAADRITALTAAAAAKAPPPAPSKPAKG